MTTLGTTISAITAAALSLAASGEAHARPGNEARPFMPRGSIADAPVGFVEMCARDRALCMMGSASGTTSQQMPTNYSAGQQSFSPFASVSAPAGPALDEKALHRLIRRINSSVNRSIIQVRDFDENGPTELWRRPLAGRDRTGDCEDLAIEKRAQLTEAGVPPQRMFYAVSYLPHYGLHTVLIVRFADGDYILDNMTPHILHWSASKQIWLRRQVAGEPLRWVRVDGLSPGTDLAEVKAGTVANPS